MAIELPASPTYRSGKWGVISNAMRFESPVTRSAQTVGRVGDLWTCQLTLPPMEAEEAYDWAAVLVQLAGQREAAYVSPPYRRDLGTFGTPVVDGADQTGTTLKTKGWAPLYTLPRGCWFHYETGTFRMLHITTAAATSDESGDMDIPIRHMIRKSPPDEAALTLSKPSCEMIADVPDVDLLDLVDSVVFGVSIAMREDVN